MKCPVCGEKFGECKCTKNAGLMFGLGLMALPFVYILTRNL